MWITVLSNVEVHVSCFPMADHYNFRTIQCLSILLLQSGLHLFAVFSYCEYFQLIALSAVFSCIWAFLWFRQVGLNLLGIRSLTIPLLATSQVVPGLHVYKKVVLGCLQAISIDLYHPGTSCPWCDRRWRIGDYVGIFQSSGDYHIVGMRPGSERWKRSNSTAIIHRLITCGSGKCRTIHEDICRHPNSSVWNCCVRGLDGREGNSQSYQFYFSI